MSTRIYTTSAVSTNNASPDVNPRTNGRPPKVALVPVTMYVNSKVPSSWSKNQNPYYPAPESNLAYDMQEGEWAFSIQGESEALTAGDVLVYSSLNRYDGPKGISIQEQARLLEIRLPGEEYKSLRESVIASLTGRFIKLQGTTTQVNRMTDQNGLFVSGQKTTTIAGGGLDMFTSETGYVHTKQVIVVEVPTLSEIENRMNLQRQKGGMIMDKITLIARATNPKSYSQRQMHLIKAYLEAHEIYHELAIIGHNRLIAGEILAFVESMNCRMMDGLIVVGALMDAGIVCTNSGHSAAELNAMMQANPALGIDPIPAVANENAIVHCRSDCADMEFNPQFFMTALTCTEDKQFIMRNDQELINAGPVNPLPVDRTPSFAAARSDQLVPAVAEMLGLITPTYLTNDASPTGGLVAKFLNESILAKHGCMHLRNTIARRLIAHEASANPNLMRHLPGAYKNQQNHIGCLGFSSVTVAIPGAAADYYANPNTALGKFLTKTMLNTQMQSTCHAQQLFLHLQKMAGVVADPASEGNNATFVHSVLGC